jgi:hypothetical protein
MENILKRWSKVRKSKSPRSDIVTFDIGPLTFRPPDLRQIKTLQPIDLGSLSSDIMTFNLQTFNL